MRGILSERGLSRVPSPDTLWRAIALPSASNFPRTRGEVKKVHLSI
jgi:hypothetical protein